MKLGIVIVSHDRSVHLENCVRAVYKQIEKRDQILVIDNNSSAEESLKYKRTVSTAGNENIRYLRYATNSIPAGRNKGIQVLLPCVDIIAFLDDDCIASDHWVSLIKRQHELNNRVDVLQGSVNHLPKDNFYALFTAEMYRNWLESNKTSNGMRTFDSKNVSFKVRVFQNKQNRFDERLRYSSDIELGHRLCRQGLRIRYEPSIRVNHYERDSFIPFIKQHINIAVGEKNVGIGLFPARYSHHVRSVAGLAKQFIVEADIPSLMRLCIVVPMLFVIRYIIMKISNKM